MKVFLKALLKCRYPVVAMSQLDLKFVMSIPTKKLRGIYASWYLSAYVFHQKTDSEMLSQSRLFIAYDGALDCAGRDSEEFYGLCVDRMGESMDYWSGKVSPRVELTIAFEDPERFPYQYVKWKTVLCKYLAVTYVKKHYTWISFSVLMVLLNILSLLVINL